MIIEGYNVRLIRITAEDSEMIRKWRNLDHVRAFMEYKTIITRTMQEAWFKSVNTLNNIYFLIEYKSDRIGVINAKNISWKDKTFEVGLFMGYEKGHFSIAPILATLCFFDVFIYLFKMDTIKTKIHRDNIKARHFDIELGFNLVEGEEGKDFQYFTLERENYIKKAAEIRNKAVGISGKNKTLCIISENEKDFIENKSIYDLIPLKTISINQPVNSPYAKAQYDLP